MATAPLNLTSLERMRTYLKKTASNTTDDFAILDTIGSVSRKIEQFLRRKTALASYTQYFNVKQEQRIFYPFAYPISSLTSFYIDSDGLYDGDELAMDTDYIVTGENSLFVDTQSGYLYTGYRTARAIYTGGMANHGTQSTFTGTITGSWTVGRYATGGTSGAVGIVRAVTATTITIENLYGIFQAGETATESTTIGGTATVGVSAVLTTITYQSLAEAYPDITKAAQMQIRYELDHKFDLEVIGVQRESTDYRTSLDLRQGSRLLGMVEDELRPYRNKSDEGQFFARYTG